MPTRPLPALAAVLLAASGLVACASAPPERSGFLSAYEGLAPREDTLRAAIAQRSDAPALAGVTAVAIAPTVMTPGAGDWMTPGERALVLREVDAQLCFELTERYDLAADPLGAHQVRAAVTEVAPTGRVASAASAAASFFIPGPIGVRAPGTLGGLAAEAELLSPDGRQLAATTWRRTANAVGTDNPSLSRVGDALQFAEPFADAAAQAMTAPERESRPVPSPDPCAQYGPRFRPEGFLARFATGLYVPETSGARAAPTEDPN